VTTSNTGIKEEQRRYMPVDYEKLPKRTIHPQIRKDKIISKT
jgi:hypothetical protein